MFLSNCLTDKICLLLRLCLTTGINRVSTTSSVSLIDPCLTRTLVSPGRDNCLCRTTDPAGKERDNVSTSGFYIQFLIK